MSMINNHNGTIVLINTESLIVSLHNIMPRICKKKKKVNKGWPGFRPLFYIKTKLGHRTRWADGYNKLQRYNQTCQGADSNLSR